MPKFRKKPVEIEAVKFDGDFDVICRFVGPENLITTVISNDPRIAGQVWDRLHSTWVGFGRGDSIIRGVKGEFYPCEEEVFDATYDPAGEYPTILVGLLKKAEVALERLHAATGTSKVDLMNQAIQVLQFLEARRAVGDEVVLRNRAGQTEKVSWKPAGEDPDR